MPIKAKQEDDTWVIKYQKLKRLFCPCRQNSPIQYSYRIGLFLIHSMCNTYYFISLTYNLSVPLP